MNLKNLTRKLFLFIMIVDGLLVVSVGFFSYKYAQDAMQERIFAHVSSLRDMKVEQLRAYFDQQYNSIRILSENPTIKSALHQLTEDFDQGISAQAYQMSMQKFHPYLKRHSNLHKIHDMLLINAQGQVIYSTRGEDDLAKNVRSQAYSKSVLLDAFERGLTGYFFSGFDFYEPSQQPIAFCSFPIFDQDVCLGVMVFKLSTAQISFILNQSGNLGYSEKVILVDQQARLQAFGGKTLDGQEEQKFGAKIYSSAITKTLEKQVDTQVLFDHRKIKVVTSYRPFEHFGQGYALICQVDQQEISADLLALRYVIISFCFVFLLILGYWGYYLSVNFVTGLTALGNAMIAIKDGKNIDLHAENSALSPLWKALLALFEKSKVLADVAERVSKQVKVDLQQLKTQEDRLSKALVEMVEKIEQNNLETAHRKQVAQIWTSISQAIQDHFGHTQNLADNVLLQLVKHTSILQACLFVVEELHEKDSPLLLQSAYAYDRKKIFNQQISPGQGIIGQVFIEKKALYIDQVPADFFAVHSAVGQAKPKVLFVLPLIADDAVIGVLELAAFDYFSQAETEVIEKTAHALASALMNAIINQKNELLLIQAQKQAEEMRAQEEEMRQNLEELQATQEEMARRQKEMSINEHIFKSMFDNIPQAALLYNAKTFHIVAANQIVSNILSYQKNELEQMYLQTISNFASAQDFENFYANLPNEPFEVMLNDKFGLANTLIATKNDMLIYEQHFVVLFLQKCEK